MPWAPASSAMVAALTTLGIPSVRELRSNAILLTLTESFATDPVRILDQKTDSGSSSQVLADARRDLLGPRGDVVLVLPLDHDPEQRLRPGVSDQEPAIAGQA